jgi:two-component system cell cycle sensor histidine kinase/response regulator CckA
MKKMPAPHRILVVDDEEKIRKSLGGLLEDNGYEVVTAGSGPECLQILSSQKVDLVILDIVMPGMSGIEALQKIKEKYKDTEVIIISGYADKEKAIAAFRLGVYDLIEKPFESKEILNTINNCLNQLGLRKEVERKTADLVRAEEKYRDLYDNAPDMYHSIDKDGYIIEVNQTEAEALGYRNEELIGRHLTDIFSGDSKKAFEKDFPVLLNKGSLSGLERQVICKDGSVIDVSINVRAVYDEKGEPVKTRAIMRDITEKRKLEAQLLHAQKMEAIGQFAGGIAHDFNNILTVIIGYGHLLQVKLNMDKTLNSYVTCILNSAQKAASLTHSILAFSKKQLINTTPVNIKEIILALKKLLPRLIGEDIELSVHLTGEDLIVMADTTQIEQVLMNLATNARDAMPDGGSLVIRTDSVRIDDYFINNYGFGRPGNYALISVTDTGHGMEDVTKEKIFEPFFTTKEVGKGTGLGLSMAYGIIKQHNGYINVYSELGKGSTFKIYLPVIKSDVEEMRPAAITMPTGGTEVILLAEDNEEVRKLTRTVLDSFGYEVIEAVDGEDAINKFKEDKDKIQLLIFDLIMPQKNGKEAFEEIKKIRPNIKVLFSSGYAADIIQKKGGIEEGINTVQKPISPRELIKKVREILDR